ncbi:MAG: hypothetical protein RLZ45_2141 [Verrucomicrobiota bacterium]
MSPPELERLYDTHAQAVFVFLLNITRSETDAREALQELFLKLGRLELDPAALRDERAYLLRLAHHQAIDSLRRRETRHRLETAASESRIELFASAPDPDTAAFRRELSTALAALPSEQRSVVHLKLWEGRSFLDIAAILQIPANTAASRYRYGLEKLRDRLQPLYDEIRP